MFGLFRNLLGMKVIQPMLKPVLRLVIGLIAIPVFRFLMRNVFRLQEMDEEMEKDLEQWFKASLVLLFSTKNMEQTFEGLLIVLIPYLDGGSDQLSTIATGMRLMLVIGVVEMMPDQELFSIIHPGPPKLKYDREKSIWRNIRDQFYPFAKGMVCQHLNRSSPVFAFLAAIAEGTAGWICYGFAITQYLIIGLVTSRDRALDALTQFDRAVAERRKELMSEFQLDDPSQTPVLASCPNCQQEFVVAPPTPPPKEDEDTEKAEERSEQQEQEPESSTGPDTASVQPA